MAEFQEVIKQYKRMCDNNDCCDCPFFDTTELSYYKFNNFCNILVLAHPEVYESLIMQWASKNPEPVYPTWKEWLLAAGYAKEIDDSFGCKMTNFAWNTPMPSDIAQKLGVEPKEEPCSE
jgi:hypothetical protein